MFAVAGVSGRTGAATADALLKQGQKVRVIVRDEAKGEEWNRRRAEVAVADFNDPESMTRALTGVTGAYLMLPPTDDVDVLASHARTLSSLVTAIKKANLKRLLFLSSAGAQHPVGTGPIVALHAAEKALGNLVPSVTFLRPASFIENWGPQLLTALDTGTIVNFGHTHLKFPQVGAHDVGVAAANALVENVSGHRFLELAGKENWSAEDVAAAVTSLLGTQIKAIEVPVEAAAATFEKMGMPPAVAALRAELFQARARGLLTFAHPHQFLRGATSLYDTLKTLV